ncbi:MAG: hypothetical protein AB7G88_14160, partial [Thermomicrobiales bacterium]
LLPSFALLGGRRAVAQGTNVASMQIVDIGLPEGVTEPRAAGISDNGDVVINALIDDAPAVFLYRNESFERFGGDDVPASAATINEAGTAVGWSLGERGPAAVQFGEDMLVTMPGDSVESRARGVNVEGTVVGEAVIEEGGPALPVYWTQSTVEVLPAAGDGSAGAVLDVNTIEQMVGWSETGGELAARHATLWEGGEAKDLGTLGGNLSEARAINETGLIVGASLTSADQNTYQEAGGRACSWQDGQIADLGLGPDHAWGVANDVNDVGMIVGVAGRDGEDPAGITSVAVLWSVGEVLDLNEIATGGDGLVLVEAVAVNAFGQILCNAVDTDGQSRIVVLSVIGN